MSRMVAGLRLVLGGAVCGAFLGPFVGGLVGLLCAGLIGDASLGLDAALLGGFLGLLTGAVYGAILVLRDKPDEGSPNLPANRVSHHHDSETKPGAPESQPQEGHHVSL